MICQRVIFIHWGLFESICLGMGLSYEMITEINK